jgi:hypothetical protein
MLAIADTEILKCCARIRFFAAVHFVCISSTNTKLFLVTHKQTLTILESAAVHTIRYRLSWNVVYHNFNKFILLLISRC